MPGRKADHAAPVSWNLAIQIAGSLERLKARAKSERTWRGWKEDDEVPAYIVAPFLLEWWRSRAQLIEVARREARIEVQQRMEGFLDRGRAEPG